MSSLIPTGHLSDEELADLHRSLSNEATGILTRSSEPLTEDERQRVDAIEAALSAITERRDRIATATRFAASASVESGDGTRDAGPAFHRSVDPFDVRYRQQVGDREAALRFIGDTPHIDGDAKTEMERKLNQIGTPEMRGFDEYVMLHSSDDYIRGFFKLSAGDQFAITPAEANAIRAARAWAESRSLAIGSSAAGGALLPTVLDPTVVLTNTGTANPLRQISRVVSTMQNVWHGVASQGVTFSWSTESGDSSDISPTFAAPAITCYKAHGTVVSSIEAFEDINGLGAEVARELADAKERHEAAAWITGSGSGQPYGIVTALTGVSGVQLNMATNSVMTATDVVNVQNALAPRWQPNASWIGNLAYHNRVRAFGDTYFERTVTFDKPRSTEILGRPAYEASEMTSGLNTSTNPALVYGDFQNYVIADRIGMAIEFVPHLFSTGNGLPNGRRGWYAHYRVGADSVNDSAFVLSVNPAAT